MRDGCEARILGSPEASVVQTKKVEMEHPLLVCCFPSAGVVGTIVANTMIDQFKMEEVAHVRSRYMPSAAVFLEGRLRHPFRIYSAPAKNLLVVTSELPIQEEGMYMVSSALLDWAAEKGVKETVILDGIPVQGLPSERKVLFAAEEEKLVELRKYAEMEMLDKGIITGIAGSILSETLCRSMVGFALLTPAIAVIPDPDAAVQLLEILNKLYGFGVSVEELKASGLMIRQRMEEMAQQVHGMQKRSSAPGPTYDGMYA
ncbi:MAG: proteasome assembly chaperone family protein [Candidatus Thorarchaeota archaeon]|nr:proteasome assembly chaperone family protein [Candidatus Thorarchaeota archaeon]